MIDEARGFASTSDGPVLVLAPETLQQIEDAEAADGFEGGMSGADGEGGYSRLGGAALDFKLSGRRTSGFSG